MSYVKLQYQQQYLPKIKAIPQDPRPPKVDTHGQLLQPLLHPKRDNPRGRRVTPGVRSSQVAVTYTLARKLMQQGAPVFTKAATLLQDKGDQPMVGQG